MNGIDPILDREYQQQLAEEAAEKERIRIASLPKYAIGTEDGVEYRHFQGRELQNHPVPHIEFPKFVPKEKDWYIKSMNGGHQKFQRIPMSMMFTKEYIQQQLDIRDGKISEIKTSLSKSDFDHNPGVKMSFK